MPKVSEIVESVRSKNAGPFWLTIDIFCGKLDTYQRISENLNTKDVGDIFNLKSSEILRFDIPALRVIKFSLPRPYVQGSVNDRDMHGATWAALIYDLTIC